LHIDLDRLKASPATIWEVFLEVEQTLAGLPLLSETLRQTDGQRTAALQKRAALLGVATMHPESLLLLTRLFRDEGLEMADYLSERHAATLDASEKQALLPAGVHVQKTVTLLLDGKLLLVTSIGDGELGRKERIALLKRLGLSRETPHHFRFNPPNIVPESDLGQLRGIVNPFIQPDRDIVLGALVHLPWPEAWAAEEVAVSISPCESVRVPLQSYWSILSRYIAEILPDLDLIELKAT